MKKIAVIIAALVFLWMAAISLSDKSFILLYHNVGTFQYGLKGAYISARQFLWQMKYLKFRGYRSVPLEELVGHLQNGRPLPKKVFAITFDDGMQNNYHNAFPILHQLDYTATVFIPTDHVGKTISYSINAPEPRLSWDEIKVMSREWDFGGHGITHTNLTIIPPDQVRREVVESREILQKMIGKQIGLFCYPFGKYNDVPIRILDETGYKAAVSIDAGLLRESSRQKMYALPRIEWKGLTPSSIKAHWDLKWFYLKILLGV
jgi:peptidoglycan/xylan/chitin deacetylase (PgdA/CDA1 family)